MIFLGFFKGLKALDKAQAVELRRTVEDSPTSFLDRSHFDASFHIHIFVNAT